VVTGAGGVPGDRCSGLLWFWPPKCPTDSRSREKIANVSTKHTECTLGPGTAGWKGEENKMLRNAKDLRGFTIRATDGELGTVDELYFDDETWAIRYLTVETGGWLAGRQVLISPISVIHADWQTKRVDVALTKKQVENSPEIDTHQPVSRQHEAAFNRYYGYPYYWGGPYLWGAAPYPADLVTPPIILPNASLPNASTNFAEDSFSSEPADSHLRSTGAVTGYAMEASDGEIGHVDGFVVDDDVWAIRYLEVATRNWWPGKKVLVSPAWIETLSWADAKVYTGLTREAIQNAPPYVESTSITREYENRLYFHYGRPPYWLHEAEHSVPIAVSGKH
jgi:hypothetical protein